MQIFEGRRVVCQYALNNDRTPVRRPKVPPSKLLYIGNLGYEMTDRDLNDLFKDVENLIDVRVTVDRRTGQLRGFAHAEFLDVPSARAAMEILSRKAPYGRKLNVDFSTGKKLGSGDHSGDKQ